MCSSITIHIFHELLEEYLHGFQLFCIQINLSFNCVPWTFWITVPCLHNFFFNFLFLLLYLKGGDTERVRSISCLTPQVPEKAEGKSQEFNLDSQVGSRGRCALAESWTWESTPGPPMWPSNVGCRYLKWHLNHCIKCPASYHINSSLDPILSSDKPNSYVFGICHFDFSHNYISLENIKIKSCMEFMITCNHWTHCIIYCSIH